jgi:hypothetical protein
MRNDRSSRRAYYYGLGSEEIRKQAGSSVTSMRATFILSSNGLENLRCSGSCSNETYVHS